ncbi:hypothetical protein KKG46_02730 [Patescibacteria group bacterium]|nr:hypothetical protein [Patescibacteria group bacterium]
MPPRKTSTSSTPPKRRRKAPVTSGQTAGTQKSYLLSPEEKRQLIMAHAEMRQPVDSMQRFSLWAGVFICVMAIGVGWLYTMRQTIVDAMDVNSQVTAIQETLTPLEAKEELHNNLQTALEKLEALEQQNNQELMLQMQQNQQASSTESASSTQVTTSTETSLFIPVEEPETKEPAFPIPQGLEIDTQ